MSDDPQIIVTGAGSGIGRATAHRLATDGWRVVAADIDIEAARMTADQAVARIRAGGVDVASENSVDDLIAGAAAGGAIAGLVNAAGVGSTTNAVDTPFEAWERVMAVNARGTFLCCKYTIPHLRARGDGTIVNIASVAGLVGLRNRAAYCASKGAVIALTRALALDHVGDGIRVNAICPGTIDTPWVRRLVEDTGESIDELRARQPMGRLGTPEEIAGTVAWLLGPDAAFATGTAFVIDGGLTAG